MTIIRKERGDITVDFLNIKKVIKQCFEKLFAHKCDNLDEMDQFFCFLQKTNL
jgi:hypothetical protein